jgi:hypothetical protein
MIRRYRVLTLKILMMISLFTAANLIITGCYPMQIQSDSSGSNYDSPRDYNIDELNQYGQWIDVDNYGRVWKPSVVSDWEPYYNGHWIFADSNWTWVSYEPFGWIVYHYGNWYNDPVYGWVWIPENNGWSPAVVQWYQYDDYVSWAPLPPRGSHYKGPFNEHDSRYWHTVNSNVFLNDDVGHLQEVHPALRKNIGERPSKVAPSNPKNSIESPGSSVPSVSKPAVRDVPTPVRVRELTGERTSIPVSPTAKDLEGRTGNKVQNVNVTRQRQASPATSSLQKMNLPNSERKRVETHQQNVKQNVLVPKRPLNPRPTAPPAKKDEKK